MAEPRKSAGIGVWPLLIGVAAVILAVVLFFLSGPVDEPTPTPDSPAATGTVGEPAGSTGATPQPGAPSGTEVPADTAPAAN